MICPQCGQPTKDLPPGIQLLPNGCQIDGVNIRLSVGLGRMFRALLRNDWRFVTLEELYFAIHDPETSTKDPLIGSVYSGIYRLRRRMARTRYEIQSDLLRGYRLRERESITE
jgi:DNA-binding response OmpR family regulator